MRAAAAGIAAGRWLVQRGPRRIGRRGSSACGRGSTGLALRVLALAVGVGPRRWDRRDALNGALTGELRILGYVTGERGRTQPPLAGVGEMPPGWTFTGDPTWDFYVAAVAPGPARPGAAATPSPIAVCCRVRSPTSGPGLDGRGTQYLIVLLGLLAAPVVAWPWLDARRRRLLLTWWVFGAALLAGSCLLFAISDTYVPQRVGPRRLMPYELFLPVVAAAWALWAIDRAPRAWLAGAAAGRGGRCSRPGAALAILGAGVVSAGAGSRRRRRMTSNPG